MKKLAYMLGIGVIATAVIFAPAFAQQTTPPDRNAPAAVQPGPDMKANAPAPSANPAGDVKTDKSAPPAKSGTEVKSEAAPGKPARDVKTGSASAKTAPTTKSHAKAVATPKHHVKKASRNPGSGMRAKACLSAGNACRKAGNSTPATSSTAK